MRNLEAFQNAQTQKERRDSVKGGWTLSSFVQAQTIAASFLPKLPHI